MVLTNIRTIIFAIVALLLLELLTCRRYRGPEIPRPQDDSASGSLAGSTQFSAERAITIHRHLFPNTPHPAGSEENGLVRERLVELLKEQGWEVEVLSGIVQSRGNAAETVNLSSVIARRREQDHLETRPLLLTTHYDSCRFGPGAGDAGACVAAVLDAGRLLTQDLSILKRQVWLIFTDGEEAGMLGASEFVRQHPVSKKRPFFLNFDARGTTGPVVMYETHSGNSSAVEQWINSLAKPRVTGSLFTAIYRSLPNNTDFTVFQEAGWQGFNFAVIDGAHRYHQPDDTLENLDPRSVQHFGEHALNVGFRIAASETETLETTENAVFFDVLGWRVVHYPVSWSFYLRFILLLTAVQLYGRQALSRLCRRDSARVWCAMLLMMVVTAAMGWVFSAALRGTSLLPRAFVWYGHSLSFLMWCLSLLISFSIAHGLLWRIDSRSVWNAFWLGQAVTNLCVSIFLPEFSHLLLVPGVAAVLLTFTVRPILLRTLLATAAAGVLLIPVQHLLAIALGPTGGLMLFPAFALIAMPMLPLFGRSIHAGTSGDQLVNQSL